MAGTRSDMTPFGIPPIPSTAGAGASAKLERQTSDSWGTGLLMENESASISFDEPGSYDYICSVHPYMTATVTVEETL